MFRPKLFFLLLAVVCLASSYSVLAFDDWQPINPEELKMTADAAHQGDAIILYHEETADDMSRHRWVYKRLKVLTEKGKDRASVEIPYDAKYVGISDIRARSIAPDGAITPFAGKAFNSTIVKAHGVKYLAKVLALPNVQVGSIIEWKYTEYWESYVFAPHWVLQNDLLTKRAKFTFVPMFKAGHYIEDSRGDIKDRVFYTTVGLPANTAIKTTANNRMELELKDIPAFEEEDFTPPSEMLKMRVDFYYGSDKMGKPQEFWKSEGKYWSKELDKFAAHSAAVAAAVSKTILPTDTPDQKARKIYAYVQKIKNLSYTGSDGRLEELLNHESREKRTVDDVLQLHEGFRDEIARLFWAMARAANLQAFAMRVADRDEYFFQANIPNPSQLTSEIVIVNVDGKEVFLDPGTPLCPFGHLAGQHTATQGLRQSADGAQLAPTPGASYKEAISKRVGRLTLSDDGSATGKIGIGWAGEEALTRRLSGLKTDEAGRKKELEDELKAMLPAGALVHLDSVVDWDNAEKQLSATFSVEIPSFASTAGKRLLVPTNLFQSRTRQPFAHGERKQPVYFNFPYYLADETTITFPPSYQTESLPAVQPIKTDYSAYSLKHSAQGNSVTINRTFAMAEIAFQQKEYAGLRKFLGEVNAADSQPLVLTATK
ncbi:MAG: transglutaminase protein [Candidatus Angelobacter sp.]|nr:transglutaminase protein [Candidatus Angelobacter sp.]